MNRAASVALAAVLVLSVSFGGGYGTISFFSDETTIDGSFTAADEFREHVVESDVGSSDDADWNGTENTESESVGGETESPPTDETESPPTDETESPPTDETESPVQNGTEPTPDEAIPSDSGDLSQSTVGNESDPDGVTGNATDGEPSPEPVVPDDESDPAGSADDSFDDKDGFDTDGELADELGQVDDRSDASGEADDQDGGSDGGDDGDAIAGVNDRE